MAVITSLLHIFTFSVIKYCYEFIITYFVFYKFIITWIWNSKVIDFRLDLSIKLLIFVKNIMIYYFIYLHIK